MDLEKLKARAAEINLRLSELNKEIGTPDLKEERANAIKAEVQSLLDERNGLNAQVEELERQAQEKLEKKGEPLQMDLTKRQAIQLMLGLAARKTSPTEEQKRALDKALTTTATSYVAATQNADGVNNAGVLIDTSMLFDLLKEEKKLSPIFADINFSHVKGLVVYPYRESRSAAKGKKEGEGTGRNQFKMVKLQLVSGWLQIVIDVTDEVVKMAAIDLGAYIMQNILDDLNEDFGSDLIYGTGSADSEGAQHIKGITIGATSKTYTEGKELEGLISAVKACRGSFRRGAKIYCSQDFHDSIAFALDDNGNLKFPVVNGGVGFQKFSVLPVEVDELLSDGDVLIGNVGKYFKANVLDEMHIEPERDAVAKVTTYVGSVYVASAPFPGAFIKLSKAS